MIGVDIGTTSTKAVLYEENGTVVASANIGYPLYTPSADIAEQDPEEIFTAVLQAVQQVIHVITSYSIHYTKLYETAT